MAAPTPVTSGRVWPLAYVTPSEDPQGHHNPDANRRLSHLVNVVFRRAYPGAAQSRSNLPPNPERPFQILEKDRATGQIIVKDIKFSIRACPLGFMARFPLSSPAIRDHAIRAGKEDELQAALDDQRDGPWVTDSDYIIPNEQLNFKVNYVSTGPGPEAKSLVFHTLSEQGLAEFLDEVLQNGNCLAYLYSLYNNDPDVYLTRWREEKRRRLLDQP